MRNEGNPNSSTRVHIYLSGGGFRAALGALGSVFFLHADGQWDRLARIVSVSGGGLVNARLALSMPSAADLPVELANLFKKLTSWTGVWFGMIAVACSLLVLPLAALWLAPEGPSWLVWLAVGLSYTVVLAAMPRLLLSVLFSAVVGTGRFDGMTTSEWNVEHIFVATDLSSSGSMFMSCNRLQPLVYSRRRGFFDGRSVSFRQALRASTALPPALPPLRLRLRASPPKTLRTRDRPWVFEPEGSVTSPVWLVDGGVSGNLGVQLDGRISPDTFNTVNLANAKMQRGLVPDDANCVEHGELAWMCSGCDRHVHIVDSSGLPPATPKWLAVLIHLPGVGWLYHALRSMKVMYEESLIHDQALAGDDLVGVVRVNQIVDRLARKKVARREIPRDSQSEMVFAGEYQQYSENLRDPELRRLQFPPLLWACWEARACAAQVRTGLWPVRRNLAAQVVASGY